MIQFNLLPDVKLKYIKTQHTKYLVTFISTVVSIAAVGVLVLSLVYVYIIQGQMIKKYNNQIISTQNQIMEVKDVEKMLTVQNQLNTLTGLHEKKPVATRLFGYLGKTTPQSISLDKLELNFVDSTIIFGGNGPNLEAIKVYVDALKNTRYITNAANATSQYAFSDVVLTDFARDEKMATFTISAKFDPILFQKAQEVQIEVSIPSIIDASLQQNPFQGDQ